MEEKAGPPQPILIQARTDTEPETVAAPKTTVNTPASAEPSDALFVAFCRLCERLLATLEPAGKGHFQNRETAILVKKALNDPTSLTSRQQKRFVSAVSRRLDDLSAEVADEFQKSEDHALYTSVVEHYMGHGEPSAKTRETGAATSPVNAKTSVPRSDLETAAHEYKMLKDNPPGSLGLVVLGLVLMIGGPALAILSVISALSGGNSSDPEVDVAFVCFGGIGLGLLLVIAGIAGSNSHEKATNEALQRMVSLSTTVEQQNSAPTENRWLATMIGVVFFVLFLGLFDMGLMLWIVLPLLFWGWFFQKRTGTYAAKDLPKILAAIEEEINRE